ncbi:MAG: type II toxin-antitoxin system RelB/DinJ family antitoxin [Clostridia bacterium]|nr:type II toxin-antitoxin system RelB/DinJ family antitoxin [Clostridia bacterium]
MANALVQFRTDEASRIKAIQICEKLGIDLQTYMRMCIARLISENGIPFSMKLNDLPKSRGILALQQMGKISEENGNSDMTLDEINEEIKNARKDGSAGAL